MVEEDKKCAAELAGSDLLRRLEKADLVQLYPRLVSYAKFRLENVTWLGKHPPGGVEPRDLVQEAVESLISGRRNWDVANHDDLEVVLKGIIKSTVSHLAGRADNQTRQVLSENAGVDGWGHDAPSLSPSPEQDLFKSELIAQIELLLEDDEDAGIVFLFLQEGAKPKEIARELGKPVKEIYVITRRIRRKLKEHLRKTSEVD